MNENPSTSPERNWGFRTRAIHAGARPEPVTGARAVPVFQTTSYVFEDTADAADLFAPQKYGNMYSGIGNPTTRASSPLVTPRCRGHRAACRSASPGAGRECNSSQQTAPTGYCSP